MAKIFDIFGSTELTNSDIQRIRDHFEDYKSCYHNICTINQYYDVFKYNVSEVENQYAQSEKELSELNKYKKYSIGKGLKNIWYVTGMLFFDFGVVALVLFPLMYIAAVLIQIPASLCWILIIRPICNYRARQKKREELFNIIQAKKNHLLFLQKNIEYIESTYEILKQNDFVDNICLKGNDFVESSYYTEYNTDIYSEEYYINEMISFMDDVIASKVSIKGFNFYDEQRDIIKKAREIQRKKENETKQLESLRENLNFSTDSEIEFAHVQNKFNEICDELDSYYQYRLKEHCDCYGDQFKIFYMSGSMISYEEEFPIKTLTEQYKQYYKKWVLALQKGDI